MERRISSDWRVLLDNIEPKEWIHTHGAHPCKGWEYVYRHTLPDGRMYIGISGVRPNARWVYGKAYITNTAFWAAICDAGWENIRHEILLTNLSVWAARQVEYELIKKYNTLYPNGFNRKLDDSVFNCTYSDQCGIDGQILRALEVAQSKRCVYAHT